MHIPETKIDMEVNNLCKKPGGWGGHNKIRCTGLNGEFCKTILCLQLVPLWSKNKEHSGLNPYRNPWRICHTILIFSELVTSLLIRGIQMGEMSKLGWLIRLIKHAMWADSLYFPYLLLLSISKILASSQPTLWPSSYTCQANIDFSRIPSLRLCLCSWSHMARDVCFVCCGSLSSLVFMSTLLSVC
jgi:hypothetical protein